MILGSLYKVMVCDEWSTSINIGCKRENSWGHNCLDRCKLKNTRGKEEISFQVDWEPPGQQRTGRSNGLRI